MRPGSTSRIRRRFQRLSRARGRVPHALRTLSPLPGQARGVRLACLIHAASVHSEPGSNSPLSKSRPDDSGSTSSLAPADQKAAGESRGRTSDKKPGSRTSHCAVPFPKRRPPEKRACRIIWHPKTGLQAGKAKNDEKTRKKGGMTCRTREQSTFSMKILDKICQQRLNL